MKYLGLIRSLPDPATGYMNVVVPSLSGDNERVTRPKQHYLGIRQPYQLGEVIEVESIEGQLFYTNRVFSNGEYPMTNVPEGYSFVTPFGYICFTEDTVEIVHRKGGRFSLSDTADVNTTLTSAVQKPSGFPLNLQFTKWR